MPCFTQVLTTQRPSIFSAARILPWVSASRNSRNDRARLRIVLDFAQCGKAFDGSFQRLHARESIKEMQKSKVRSQK